MRYRATGLAAGLAAALCGPSAPRITAQAEPPAVALPFDPLPYDRGAAGLGLALRRLGTTGRVLYVTAHPDDEDNGLLVALSRGRGLQVTLFTLTRGAGGLNEIGPELFQELSVLRTEETAERARWDGAEQRYGRADDFGYSYSVEECLQRWGREEMLGDVVAMVRRLRPDVVITMPARDAGGGAAHSASAQLAALAFTAAADPQRFPEQITAGLQPWQASTLFEAGVGGPGEKTAGTIVIDTASLDPLLGMGWAELGSLARGSHRTQATSAVKAPPGRGRSPLRATMRAPGAPSAAPADLFDPLDVSVAGLARRFEGDPGALRAAQEAAVRAREAYDAAHPEAALPALQGGLLALRQARSAAEGLGEGRRGPLLDRIAEEEADFGRAVALAMGLALEPVAESASAVPGAPLLVTTHVRAAVATPAVEQVRLLGSGWTVRGRGEPSPAPAAGAFTVQHEATPAALARPTQPHWHIEPGQDRNRLDPVADFTLPWTPPELVAEVRVSTAAGPLSLRMPVYGVATSSTAGERLTPLRIVPRLSLRVDPPVLPVPLGARDRLLRVYVTALAAGPGRTTVRLEAPRGWSVAPPERTVSWSRSGEEVAAPFRVSAPARAADGLLHAVAGGEGGAREQWLEVDYPHVHARPVVRAAAARALALDLKVARGLQVGYVEGAGDVVASSIEALGVPVRRLTPRDLAGGDLSAFDTIVLGVRAYQTRPDLRAHNARLLQYARDGGHLVLQLSRAELNQLAPLPFGSVSPAKANSPFTPYAGRVGVGRVSDEKAPVALLAPAHPLLSRPNRIGPSDFEGWVQERGSFLFEGADARYAELVSSRDPWPQNAGERKGLLTEAAVGAGTWTYAGLNLFRQLYVGTPGAYRILANIVSRPRGALRASPRVETRP